MNAVIGYSEMLLEDVEDGGPEELSSDLEKINVAGVELLGLVNHALAPSRVEAVESEADLESLGVRLPTTFGRPSPP